MKEIISDVRRLIGLSSGTRVYRTHPNIESYRGLLDFDPDSIVIMDPFAGQGNLMFEVASFGLKTVAMDYNPVAYVLMKSILEYPKKYGSKLAGDVKKYGEELIRKTKEEVGRFYERSTCKTLNYIWCWCIKCPYCGQRFPLANHMWLNIYKKIGYKLKITEDKNFEVEISKLSEDEGNSYTQKGGNAICINCKNTISYKHIIKDIAERRDKELMAVVVKNTRGKDFELPSEEDRGNFEEAVRYLKENWERFLEEGLIPTEDLKESELFRLTNYGLRKWHEVFTERQHLVMITLLKNIRQITREIKNQEYAKAIATYLALMLCKHVANNSIGCV